SEWAVLALLLDADGDRHGNGSAPPGGLDEPTYADGCDAGTRSVGCGLVSARLVDEWATATLDVADEPGWLGEGSLDDGAGLVGVGVGGLDVVGGGLLLVTGGGELVGGPGFGLVLTGGELLTAWHFFAAGELELWLGVYPPEPEEDGNCEAPLDACRPDL